MTAETPNIFRVWVKSRILTKDVDHGFYHVQEKPFDTNYDAVREAIRLAKDDAHEVHDTIVIMGMGCSEPFFRYRQWEITLRHGRESGKYPEGWVEETVMEEMAAVWELHLTEDEKTELLAEGPQCWPEEKKR